MRELGGFFIARRHEIDFLAPAFEGDILRIRTWIEEVGGARAVRRYDIRRVASGPGNLPADGLVADDPGDGDVIVRARTEWVYVDPTGKPRRMPVELLDWFSD